MPNHTPKLLPPSGTNLAAIAIVAEGFLSRLSFGIISFALPIYAQRIGLSLFEIGVLMTLNQVIAMALKPAMGWVADRFGLKRSFTASIVIRSLVALFLVVANPRGSFMQSKLYMVALRRYVTRLRMP
jgi:MFS family permease